jgi:hypothetical protein
MADLSIGHSLGTPFSRMALPSYSVLSVASVVNVLAVLLSANLSELSASALSLSSYFPFSIFQFRLILCPTNPAQ